jgi:hypothetical protein
VDYAFGGVESTYPPGLTAFRLTNDGTESHEMAVVRRKEGATMSWDEIFALPEEEIQEQIDFLGAGFAAAPGDMATLIVDLTPGEYLALCFVSKGSTPGVEGTGPPHVMEGMRAEFTVS